MSSIRDSSRSIIMRRANRDRPIRSRKDSTNAEPIRRSYLIIFHSLGTSSLIRSLLCSSAHTRAFPNSHPMTSRRGCSFPSISARNPASRDCRGSGSGIPRNACSGYWVVSIGARTDRPFAWSSVSIASVPNRTSRHHSVRPATITSASARRAAASEPSGRLRASGCCSSCGSPTTSSPTFFEEEHCTCLRCWPRPANGCQSRIPAANGSAEVP